MPRRVEFNGTLHEFPDGVNDEQIRQALSSTLPVPPVVPGMEKLGALPPPAGGPIDVRPVQAPSAPQAAADVTLGAIGRGIGNVIEGSGGAMRALGAERLGTVVSDAGKFLSEEPEWLKEAAQRPDRFYDPAFLSNLAFQGAGSSMATFVPGSAIGRVAGAAKLLPVGAWRQAAQYVAGTASGSVLESMADAGSAYNEAVQTHGPEKAQALFAETMKRQVPVTMLTNALGEFSPRAGGSVWKRVLEFVKDSLAEGGEEVAQGVAQRSAQNAVLGTKTPLLQGAPEEFVGGALGGAVMSGGRAIADRVVNGMAKPTAPPAAQPPVPPVKQSLTTTPVSNDPAAELVAAAKERGEITPEIREAARQQVAQNPELAEALAPLLKPDESPRQEPSFAESPKRQEKPDSSLRVGNGAFRTDTAEKVSQDADQKIERANSRTDSRTDIPIEPSQALPQAKDTEPEPEAKKYDYSSTQVNLPAPVAKHVLDAGKRIPDAKLAADGRETEPHVTVKYGLHGEDPAEVAKLLEGQGPITVKLGKASLFKNEDADVLKVDVDSEDLHKLNGIIKGALPHTENHPEYTPHVTIAYLKPGEGKKYAGKPIPQVSGKTMTIDRLSFSNKAGEKTEILLRGETPAVKPANEREDAEIQSLAAEGYTAPEIADKVNGYRQEVEPQQPEPKKAENVPNETPPPKPTDVDSSATEVPALPETAGVGVPVRGEKLGVRAVPEDDGRATGTQGAPKIDTTRDTYDAAPLQKAQGRLRQAARAMEVAMAAAEEATGLGNEDETLASAVRELKAATAEVEWRQAEAAKLNPLMVEQPRGPQPKIQTKERIPEPKPEPKPAAAKRVETELTPKQEIPQPPSDIEVRRLPRLPRPSTKAAIAEARRQQENLVGGFYRSYGGGIDEILRVELQESGPMYTVRDTESGEQRKHLTYIDPRSVVFRQAVNETPTNLAEAAGLKAEDLIAAVTKNLEAGGRQKTAEPKAPKPAATPAKAYNPNRDLKRMDRELWERARKALAKRPKAPFGVTDPLPTSIRAMNPDRLSPSDRMELHEFLGTPEAERITHREDMRPPEPKTKKPETAAAKEKRLKKHPMAGMWSGAEEAAAPAPAASVNPLKQKADEARDRLRAKMRGSTLQSGIDPNDLIDIATIGAEKMLDGAIKFKDWSAQMRSDVGDLVDWMAKTTGQSADAVLKQIHGYAKTVSQQFGAKVDDTEDGSTDEQPTEQRATEPPVQDDPRPLEEQLPAGSGGAEEKRPTRKRSRKRSEPSGDGDGASVGERDESAVSDGAGDGGVEEPAQPVGAVNVGNTRLERDYRIPDGRSVGGSPEKRFQTNIEAIRLLRQLEKDDRLPTADERDVLGSYVGWGAVPQLFAENTEEWRTRAAELRDVLSEEEFEHARRSTTNAHYTSDTVIDSMWKAMEHMGAKPGMVWLEPAVGIGNYFGRQPAHLLEGARRVGLDKDTITGKLAQKLYPDSGIEVTGFEEAELPENYFDAAISNVPFGDFGVHDPAFRGKDYLTNPIHNYFFAKSLSYVRPGGIVAFVTSRYTLDGYDRPHTKFRNWVGERADFLGAVRLPSNAFQANAGTHVITDIIFLRRRVPGAEPATNAWGESPQRFVSAGPGMHRRQHAVNEYYTAHPENILGTETLIRGQFSDSDYGVKGSVTAEQLTGAFERILPKDAFQEAPKEESTRVRLGDVGGGEDAKIGALFFTDKGELYRRASRGSAEPVAIAAAAKDRVKGQMGLRDTLGELLDAELNDKPMMEQFREKLNLQYDIFVKKHGPLSSRANIAAFDGDPDAPLLLSLEQNYNGKTAKKAPIFERRMLEKAKKVDQADSAQDALLVSLNERGRIDWDHMAALTGKPAETLQQELAGVVFEDPESKGWMTAEEYLSGSVRKKLKQARKVAKLEPRFEANVKALEAVQPEDIPPSKIFARLGVTWVPVEVYQDFIRDVMGMAAGDHVRVDYSKALGEWSVDANWWKKTSTKFETKRLDAKELLSHAFNMRKPKIYDTDSDGKSWLNVQETAAAQAKLEELQDHFQKWVFEDGDRGDQMARIYNDLHNDLRLRTYDGSHLTLPGMAKGIKLHTHQRAAIWRVITQPNALLAHAVGAGKTFEMIAGGMELKRMGLIKRPMYVVPNATLSGWQEQFTALYPGARVLVFSEKDLEKSNRQKIMARIATGNWDAVVVPHSSFQFLRVSEELFNSHYQELVRELEEQIKEAEDGGMDSRMVKRMEKAKERLLEGIQKRRAAERQDRTVTWEQLGIDQLFVDEAHEYKKLGFATKQNNIAGIDQAGNQKTFDLMMKMRHTQSHGRGVVFATGTPVTNTMGEMFSLMRYLIDADLQARGLGKFDEWAANYGRTASVFEPKPEGGGYHLKDRFSKFVNIPELASLFRSFSDVVTSDMLDIPRPEVVSRAMSTEMNERQVDFVKELQRRAAAIRQNPKDALPDCMLAVYGDFQKMALDVRMVDPDGEDHPGNRLNQAADKITEIWKDTTANRSAQLVFMDLGKPVSEGGGGSTGFSTYDELIKKLTERGIPAGEIAHIYSAKNKMQRTKLFQSVREGRIRVLLGSTAKMGVGVNVQTKLAAMHHMDLPHRPADIEQRNGRGERQGNENSEIKIYTYLTKGTLDELKAASLARKAKFISQMMQGKSTVREAEDVGGMVASMEQFQAIASGDPRVMRMMEVNAEVDRLSAIRASWNDQRYSMRNEAGGLPGRISVLKKEVELFEKLKQVRNKTGRVWKIGKQTFSGEGIRNKVVEAASKAEFQDGVQLGSSYGLNLTWARAGSGKDNILIEGLGLVQLVSPTTEDPGGVGVGTIQAVENRIESIDRWIEDRQSQLEQLTRRGKEILGEMEKPWGYQAQFEKLQAEQKELIGALGLNKDDESAGAGDEIAANVESEETDGEEEESQAPTALDEAKRLIADESGELDIDALLRQAQRRIGTPKEIFRDIKAMFTPLETRIASEPGGGEIKRRLDEARIQGKTTGGYLLNRIGASGLMKMRDAEARKLLDAMRGTTQPDNVKGFEENRWVTNWIARTAAALGTKAFSNAGRRDFMGRLNYFPQHMLSADDLRSGAKRKQVIEWNMIPLGFGKDAAEAGKLLDAYIDFLDGKQEAPKDLVAKLVAQGKTEVQAIQQLTEDKLAIRRHGSLEHAREWDSPFYDPDPRRVLPAHAASAAMRLAEIAQFGQDNEHLAVAVSKVAAAGGNWRLAHAHLKTILNWAERMDTPAERLSRLVTAFNLLKLSGSAAVNATQVLLNAPAYSGFIPTFKGLAMAFTEKGKSFGVQSGADIERVLRHASSVGAGGGYKSELLLKMYGFTQTESFNRRWAANAGKVYTQRLFEQAKKNPSNGFFRDRLSELGIDATAALKRGELNSRDLLRAGLRMSELVNFRSDAASKTEFGNTPIGRMVLQFQGFGYEQTRFVLARTADWAKGAKNRDPEQLRAAALATLIMALWWPAWGELIRNYKSWIWSKDAKEFDSVAERAFTDLASIGGFGVAADYAQAATRQGTIAKRVIGPTGGSLAEGFEAGAAAFKEGDLTKAAKWALRNLVPFGGPVEAWWKAAQ